MQNPYYEVLSPPKSGMPVIIQEFPPQAGQPACIGVAGLRFGGDDLLAVEALGGKAQGAHYGPPDTEVPGIHDIAIPSHSSWLFPIEQKDQVIALVHRVISEIEVRPEE